MIYLQLPKGYTDFKHREYKVVKRVQSLFFYPVRGRSVETKILFIA